MRKLLIIPFLVLTACTSTPQEKYYTVTVAVTEAGNLTEHFIDACNALPADNPCRSKYPAINKAAKAIQANTKELDKVFVSGKSQYYDLSLTLTQNAINDLKQIIGSK